MAARRRYLIRCVRDDGSIIEVVVKFSAFCDQQQENLAIEAFAACLAGDLGLPIPEPLLVVIPDELAAIVPDEQRKKRILAELEGGIRVQACHRRLFGLDSGHPNQ